VSFALISLCQVNGYVTGWREHLKPILNNILKIITDSRERVRKSLINLIEMYPPEEHKDLMDAGLLDILLNSFTISKQNQAIASSFFDLLTSLNNYQAELFKTEARYQTLIAIAKLNDFKRIRVLDLFSDLEGKGIPIDVVIEPPNHRSRVHQT